MRTSKVRQISEEIRATDRLILSWLSPCTDDEIMKHGSDTYCCRASKHLRRDYLASRVKKVKAWTERNGGTFKLLTKIEDKDKWYFEIKGNDHVAFVQIRFPSYGTKRNMKELMSTLSH